MSEEAEFKCISEDFVQLILYPDKELNESKVESKCGTEDPTSPIYNQMSSAYNDIL